MLQRLLLRLRLGRVSIRRRSGNDGGAVETKLEYQHGNMMATWTNHQPRGSEFAGETRYKCMLRTVVSTSAGTCTRTSRTKLTPVYSYLAPWLRPSQMRVSWLLWLLWLWVQASSRGGGWHPGSLAPCCMLAPLQQLQHATRMGCSWLMLALLLLCECCS